MCTRYTINGNAAEIAEALGAMVQGEFEWEEEIFPRAIAPGLMLIDGLRQLVPMQFALAKPGALQPFDPKFSYNNAKIENYRKWPWADPLKFRRCIVPLSQFREPCYWGAPGGKEVNFFSPADDYLGVASIYNLWRASKADEPLVTMSLLIRPASKFVMDHGHHRQPFFLDREAWDAWMAPGARTLQESAVLLRRNAYEPPLEYEVVRNMAPSWTARQAERVKKRDQQLAEIEQSGLRLGI